MVLEVEKAPASSQRTMSKRTSNASKFKSAEFIKDSDDEEQEGTSNREGAKFTPYDRFKTLVPSGSTTKHRKDAKVQSISSSQKQSPLVQNGRLPKKPKLDISSSFHKAKASVDVKPILTHNTAFQFANSSSSSIKRPLEVNGRPQNKPKLDISSSSSSDSQESDSQIDGEESSKGSQNNSSSGTGTSDGSQSETNRSMERSNKTQSETSISTGRSNESGAQLAYKNSVLCVSAKLIR